MSSKHPRWNKPPTPFPPVIRKSDIRAIQHVIAYAKGIETTSPSAETLDKALTWLFEEACKCNDNGFLADDHTGRVGAFMDGRQYVSKQWHVMAQLKPELFSEEQGD